MSSVMDFDQVSAHIPLPPPPFPSDCLARASKKFFPVAVATCFIHFIFGSHQLLHLGQHVFLLDGHQVARVRRSVRVPAIKYGSECRSLGRSHAHRLICTFGSVDGVPSDGQRNIGRGEGDALRPRYFRQPQRHPQRPSFPFVSSH